MVRKRCSECCTSSWDTDLRTMDSRTLECSLLKVHSQSHQTDVVEYRRTCPTSGRTSPHCGSESTSVGTPLKRQVGELWQHQHSSEHTTQPQLRKQLYCNRWCCDRESFTKGFRTRISIYDITFSHLFFQGCWDFNFQIVQYLSAFHDVCEKSSLKESNQYFLNVCRMRLEWCVLVSLVIYQINLLLQCTHQFVLFLVDSMYLIDP